VSPLERSLAVVLRRYMSEMIAVSVRRRAQASIGVPEGGLVETDVERLKKELESGVRLFVDPALQGSLFKELDALAQGPRTAKEAERWPISNEGDVSRVRLRARDVVSELGGSVYVAQRAATIASELSRNIVAYAKTGVVELVPSAGPPASLMIRAVDTGPGIEKIDDVLGGRYRSKTGLGKGLFGVKKLAARFDLSTGATGTRVEAEVAIG
jgi:serine/threonine-protein kinase RsbT